MDAMLVRMWQEMDRLSREIHAESKRRPPMRNGRWRPSARYEAAATAHRSARLKWEAATAGMSCAEKNAVIDAALGVVA